LATNRRPSAIMTSRAGAPQCRTIAVQFQGAAPS
jgi:hypothetical protein